MLTITTDKRINPGLFKEELAAAGLVGVTHRVHQSGDGATIEVETTANNEPAVLAVVDAHDHTLLSTQQQTSIYIESRVDEGDAAKQALFAGLIDLPVEDMLYAAYGRGWADYNGENQATIDAIIDRATAASYIQGTTQWSSAAPAERQLMIASTEATLRILQGVVRVLLR